MIIVIGAESFIGTYLVDKLSKSGKNIIATGRNIQNNKYFQSLNNVTPININIVDQKDFEKLPTKNIEAIVHLAGMMPANISDDEYNPYSYVDVNINGTLNILEFCRKNFISKIIYTSSESDISEQYSKYEILDELVPRAINYNNDHTIYAITKIASMDLIEHYSQAYNLNGIYFRLPNIFGYGQLLEHYKEGKKVINGFGTFLKKALHGESIEMWGDCEQGRDVVYVKDLVNMIIGAIENDSARGLYCAGTGVKTTLKEQIEGIVNVFSKEDAKSKIIPKPEFPSIRTYIYNVDKAKKELGYVVEYPYKEMLLDWKYEFELNRFPHFKDHVRCLMEIQ